MARGNLILALRAVDAWKAAVPELVGYENFFTHSNPQNAAVTPAQCSDGVFERIVAAIQE
jgi:hypothetical protein